MNYGDCVKGIREKVGGVFSEAEIEDLLARMARRAIKAAKEAPDLGEREAISSAARAMTKDEILKALLAKRNELYEGKSAKFSTTGIDAMSPKLKGSQRLKAWLVGLERQGYGSSNSLDAQAVARQASLIGPMATALKAIGQFHRLVNFFGLPDQQFPRLVAREIFRLNGGQGVDATGDDGAFKAAQVIAGALRKAVRMQNDAGAWIGDLTGYIARQSHDAEKIAGGYLREIGQFKAALAEGARSPAELWKRAETIAQARAFGVWRDFIMPLLHDKTFEGLDERDFDLDKARALQARGIIKDAGDPRELMMYNIFWDIVNGRHTTSAGADDMAEFRPGRPSAVLAKSVSAARVLHFKGPDEWMDYNDRYGKAGLLKTVINQLIAAGRNTAVMERFGPNPEKGFEFQKARLTAEAETRADSLDAGRINGGNMQAQYENATGRGDDNPGSPRLAQTLRTIRTWEVITKLGGIVLSKFPDVPIAGFTMARAGGNFFRGAGGVMAGVARLGSADAKRAADALWVGWRAFASETAGQFYKTDGPAGWGSYLSGLMLRVNTFEGANNGVRVGFGQSYSRFLAQEAEHAWEGLQKGTRESLQRFSLGPEDWEAVRHGLEPTDEDGLTYFTLTHTEGLANDAAKAAGLDPDGTAGFAGPEGTPKPGEPPASAEALAAAADAAQRHWKFAALIHNMIDDTVSHPRARETATLLGGTRPGTVWGEVARALTQFKQFVTTIFGRQLIPASRGYAGLSPAVLLPSFFALNALAGYLGMSAKQIARGENPRNPFGPDLGEDLKVWGGALAQGGGMGIYGDFLFGQEDRHGGSLIGDLGGPMVGDAEQIAKVVIQAVQGGAVSARTGRSPIPGELVRLGGRSIPFANLFYTRLLFDYCVLWGLQEWASPGSLQRSENQVEEKEGGSFLVSPTSVLH